MARSHYVYVVLNQDGVPVAGFTVKHEMVSWLERRHTSKQSIWRISDGPFQDRAPIEITEEILALTRDRQSDTL